MPLLLRALIKDTPLVKESRKKEEEKCPAPGGIQTHDLQITRRVLNHCAATAAQSDSYLLFPGIGFGLIYLPAIVCVSMYFEKKRAFATGIAVCGSGLGTFVMAPVSQGYPFIFLLYLGYRWKHGLYS